MIEIAILKSFISFPFLNNSNCLQSDDQIENNRGPTFPESLMPNYIIRRMYYPIWQKKSTLETLSDFGHF